MEALITIPYADIDKAARRYVEYLGSKGTAQDYERMLLQIEDAEWLDEVHEDMMEALMDVLETWSIREEDIESGGQVTGKKVAIYLPDNARSTVKDNVQRKSIAFCASYLEAQWLKIVGHNMAEVRETEASIHLKSIRSTMTHRRPPIRITPPHIPTVMGYAEEGNT